MYPAMQIHQVRFFCTLIKIESSKPATTIEEKEKLESLLQDHIKLQT